jgi:hypothetical protein
MDFFSKPPDWVTSNLPEGMRAFLQNGGWYAVLGIGGLILLLIGCLVGKRVLAALGGSRPKKSSGEELEEDLRLIPAPPPLTGDRRLTVEGVPVRLRLVVAAPAGRAQEIDAPSVRQILDQVLPGLSKIADDDVPRTRIWPAQLSYEGFANKFHKNTPVPEGEHQPSRWVLMAGRAQLDKNQVLLGLALQAAQPTTVGRLRLDKYQWTTFLRIRTRE